MRVSRDTLMNARGLVFLVAGVVILVAYVISRFRS